MEWTTEKVATLAPDAATESRGKKLATTSKWQTIGSDERAVWGECKGSGSEPYYVKIDLQGPAYGCTCPVRQLPCKHALGLFFLYVQQGGFKNRVAPIWVSDWIAKRDTKAQKVEIKESPKTAEQIEKSQKAKEKRNAERMELMQSGVDELELWLLDLLRQGFANININNKDFWEQAAAKFKDAKLAKVAYSLRETGEIAAKNPDWMEEVAARIGEMGLLVNAFRRMEKLEESMQEEVFNTLGRIVKKTDVIEQCPAIADKWLVIAAKEEYNLDNVLERRVWVQGTQSKKEALIQDFAFLAGASFEQQYIVGSALEGELVYYPAAYPQRAIFKNCVLVDFAITELPIAADYIQDFQKKYASALRQNPWLRLVSVVLHKVLPYKDGKDNFFLLDAENRVLPLANPRARSIWRMLAMSGGYPISLIGEWNGTAFEALSLWKDNNIESL